MANNTNSRDPITQADIKRYRNMLDKGEDGIRQFYRDLESKGYHSAGWSLNQYDNKTSYGSDNSLYFKNQTGKDLDNKIASELNRLSADKTLDILERKVKNRHGQTTEDLSYKDHKEVQDYAHNKSGFQGVKGIFDDPVSIYARLHGDKAAEEWYEKLRDGKSEDNRQLMNIVKKGQELTTSELARKNMPISPEAGAQMAMDAMRNAQHSNALNDIDEYMRHIIPNPGARSTEETISIEEAVRRGQNLWPLGNKVSNGATSRITEIMIAAQYGMSQKYDQAVNKYGKATVDEVQHYMKTRGDSFLRIINYIGNQTVTKVATTGVLYYLGLKQMRTAIGLYGEYLGTRLAAKSATGAYKKYLESKLAALRAAAIAAGIGATNTMTTAGTVAYNQGNGKSILGDLINQAIGEFLPPGSKIQNYYNYANFINNFLGGAIKDGLSALKNLFFPKMPEELIPPDFLKKMDELIKNGNYDLDKEKDYSFSWGDNSDWSLLTRISPEWNGDKYIDWNALNRDGYYFIFDPLALDLNGNGIETLAANGHDGALFDHERLGIRTATGWIHSNDGILVYDRNGDGKINDGGEIFGDNTLLKNGKTAAHGFEAAADLDDNGDGKLDAADSAFSKLGVWRDLNHNGISEEGEIFALKDLHIKSLNLGYTQADKDLGNGNTLAEVGSYTDEDGNEHIMGDLRLSADRLHSRYSNSIPLTDEQQQEVNLRGSGRLRDLREAAAQSSELADVLQQYKNAATKEEQLALRHKLLKAWADTDPQRFEDFKSTMKTMIQSEERKGIGLTPSQVEHMNEIMVMGFWKVLGQPDPAGQKQAELNRRIAILDAFTGTRSPNLYYFSKEEAQHIVDTVNDTYERLADSLYDGLLFQTRLRPYLDAIRLRINEAGEYGIDYSGVSALFTEIHKKNPGKAFTDLGELLAKGNADGKNTAMAPLVEQFVQFAAEAEQNGTFTQYADVLGKKNLETLGHRIGGDGDDSLSGNESANYLSGGAGDDILSGGAGHDTLDGGTGNDQLYGGSEESDTYLFRAGHGKDHVSDNARNQAEADTLRFSGAQLKNAQFSREGHDLAIRAYGDAGDQVNIKDFFWYSTGKYYNLQFDDATLTKDDIAGLRIAGNGTDKGETIYGWYNADVIDAGAGDDYVYGGANNDELSGGDGNDRLYGGEGNDKLNGDSGNDELAGENGDDQLNGGEGDDTLYGGAGHDTLDGGTGNDSLNGGSYESDTYLFRAGHGKDVVSDYANKDEQADTLRFNGAKAQDAVFDRDGWNLNIKAYGSEDQVTVKDYFYSDSHSRYNFAFDDASYSVADIRSRDLLKDGLPSASVAVTEENSASQIATDAAASAQTVKEAKAEAAPASSAGTTQTAENIAAQTATETAASAQTVKEAKAETVPTTSVGTLSTEKAAVAQQAAAADRDTTATAPAKALAAQVESAGQQGGVATTDSHPVTPTTIGTQSAATASDAKAAAQAQHLIEAMAAFDTRSATADKLATPPLQQPPLAAAAADSTVKPLLP